MIKSAITPVTEKTPAIAPLFSRKLFATDYSSGKYTINQQTYLVDEDETEVPVALAVSGDDEGVGTLKFEEPEL